MITVHSFCLLINVDVDVDVVRKFTFVGFHIHNIIQKGLNFGTPLFRIILNSISEKSAR